MNIVITGASRGIGKELVRKLSTMQPTAKIYICSRKKDELEHLASEIAQTNALVKIIPVAIDLEKMDMLESVIEEKIDSAGIDILINNAGYLLHKPFDEINYAEALAMAQVNYLGTAQLIRFCLPKLKVATNAHVVNITSMGGFQGSQKFAGLSYYSASKAALASLTECLSHEYGHTTIKFNALALGAVQTEMLHDAFPGYEAPVTAVEMAEFVADFAINGHRYMNGRILPVALNNPS